MKTPELSRILKAAENEGLCGPIVENLKYYLLEKTRKGGKFNNLQVFARKSKNMPELIRRIGTGFLGHLIAKPFRVVVP